MTNVAPPADRYVVFSGHRIDADDRPVARFPKAAESVARRLIFDAVTSERDRYPDVSLRCIASGANGGDILFLESCIALGLPAEIYLATDEESFVATSVADGGDDWVARYRQLSDRLPVHILPEDSAAEENNWQRTNQWMLETALAGSGEQTTVIALWDGEAGDGAGGTKDMALRAEASDAQLVHIDTRQLK